MITIGDYALLVRSLGVIEGAVSCADFMSEEDVCEAWEGNEDA